MGSKKQKRRFFIVNYKMKPGGAFDEFVELSKKKLGTGKITDSDVVLDLVNEDLVKYDIPGAETHTQPTYENVYSHFHKYYGRLLDQFIK